MPNPKLYMIDVQSTHRIFYVVQSSKPVNGQAVELITQAPELGQQWMGETIIGIYEVSEADVIKKYDECNGRTTITRAEKLSCIMDVDPIPVFEEDVVDPLSDDGVKDAPDEQR